MSRIFLSYAREDEAQVQEIYRRLLDEGFHPWMDKINLLPGQRWQQEIPRALRASELILIFFSHHSVAKHGYIQREFKLALDTLQEMPEDVIHTIPVRLDACAIPDQFAFLQWCNLFENNGYGKLVDAIQAGLSQRRQPTHLGGPELTLASKTSPHAVPQPDALLMTQESYTSKQRTWRKYIIVVTIGVVAILVVAWLIFVIAPKFSIGRTDPSSPQPREGLDGSAPNYLPSAADIGEPRGLVISFAISHPIGSLNT